MVHGADPRVEIKRLIDELSHRRVLFNPHAWEVPKETLTSVLEIRRHVVDTQKNVKTGTDTHKILGIMAGACLAYLDNREIEHNRAELEEALDDLRTIFGACLLVLSDTYGLAVEGQIAQILPEASDLAMLRNVMSGSGGHP